MNKKLTLSLLSIMVLVPLLGGCYLLYIVSDIESNYIGSINPEEIIKKIEESNNIEIIKATAKHYFLSEDKALRDNISYFKGFYEILFLLSLINLALSTVIVKEFKKSSNKALQPSAKSGAG